MMEQMIECLLAKIDAMREKVVSHHEIMAEMRAWRKEMKAYPEKWRQIHRK
jgi:hypothetical protein